MRVLFICSGNSTAGISPVVARQGESLERAGLTLDFFPVMGKGLRGYLRSSFLLRRHIKSNIYDIYHGHYSLSGFVSTFALIMAGKNPRRNLIVSLMGSDLYDSHFLLHTARFFARFCWAATIVKSSSMKTLLGLSSSEVIPNGVNMKIFFPADKYSAKVRLGYEVSQKLIIFIGDPGRPEKNYPLAIKVVEILDDKSIRLVVLDKQSAEAVADHLNAADLLLSTSLWEGSANVIKEAMACNLPVVATPAGDAKELLDDCEGNFVTTFDPGEIAMKVRLVLSSGSSSHGRDKLFKLGLDDISVAERIQGIYKEMPR